MADAPRGDYAVVRTFAVDYTGEGQAMDDDDLFDEVMEVFERHGFKVEGGFDCPSDDVGGRLPCTTCGVVDGPTPCRCAGADSDRSQSDG